MFIFSFYPKAENYKLKFDKWTRILPTILNYINRPWGTMLSSQLMSSFPVDSSTGNRDLNILSSCVALYMQTINSIAITEPQIVTIFLFHYLISLPLHINKYIF